MDVNGILMNKMKDFVSLHHEDFTIRTIITWFFTGLYKHKKWHFTKNIPNNNNKKIQY